MPIINSRAFWPLTIDGHHRSLPYRGRQRLGVSSPAKVCATGKELAGRAEVSCDGQDGCSPLGRFAPYDERAYFPGGRRGLNRIPIAPPCLALILSAPMHRWAAGSRLLASRCALTALSLVFYYKTIIPHCTLNVNRQVRRGLDFCTPLFYNGVHETIPEETWAPEGRLLGPSPQRQQASGQQGCPPCKPRKVLK